MTVSCSVYGCTNRHSKENPRQFFKFPLKKNDLLKLWLNSIRRINFVPTKTSKVCSDHFIKTDYLVRPGSYVQRLKPDAVPSVFPSFPAHLKKKVPIERKPRKRISKIENISQEKIPEVDDPISPAVELITGFALSISTQTEDTKIQPDVTNKLRREIKSLKQTLRRKNNCINRLKELVKQLKGKKLLNENNIEYHFEDNNDDIFENQLEIQTMMSTGRNTNEI